MKKKEVMIVRKNASLIPDNSSGLEENSIKAIITTFGNKDAVGDIMQNCCLDKFISKFNNNETGIIKMLFNHDRKEILGKWTKFEVQGDNVIGFGKFSEVNRAKDVKTLINDGILKSVSIGFKAIEFDYRDDKDYEERPINFKEIEILETSIVDAPANPKADILETKSLDPRGFEINLREFGFSRNVSKRIVKFAKDILKNSEQREVVEDNSKILEAINNMNYFKQADKELKILEAINN